jgi:hypothetical protein
MQVHLTPLPHRRMIVGVSGATGRICGDDSPIRRLGVFGPRSSGACEAPLSSSQLRLGAKPEELFPLAQNTMQSRRATAIEYVLVACTIALLVTVYFRGDFGAPKACHPEAPLEWTGPPNRA